MNALILIIVVVAIVFFVSRLVASARKTDNSPAAQFTDEVIIFTDVGAQSSPANFELQIMQFEGALNSELRERGIGAYRGFQYEMRGVTFFLVGYDGEQVFERARKKIRAFLSFNSGTAEIRRSGRLVRRCSF